MQIKNVLLVGGSGFVGCHVAQQLARMGCRLTVPTRRRERAKHLLVLPDIDVVEANVHEPAVLDRLARGQDVVINLVGILHGGGGNPYGRDFARAHVELPRAVVAACLKNGVPRLLHMSALKASRDAPSQYLRSKADGEAAIREAGHQVATTIFRPSVIFGPGDRFLRLFAELARRFPVLPLARPDARFQPVFVEDVAGCFVDSLSRPEAFGAAYELGGPRVYTLRQLVRYVCEVTNRPRPVIGLPGPLSYLQALALELAPGKLMSRDNLASMQVDSVVDGPPLPFGRTPTPLESVAPGYLAAHMPRARYMPFRQRAGR